MYMKVFILFYADDHVNYLGSFLLTYNTLFVHVHDWLYIKSTQKFLFHSKDRETNNFFNRCKRWRFDLPWDNWYVIPVESKAIV